MTPPDHWWQTFFDDAYVEAWAEQGAFDTTEETAAQLLEFLDLPAGASVLDVPCGFGRFSQPLHNAGLEVTGVDASSDQIRRARRDHPGPDYLVGDMREPPSGPFDAVLNLFTSFGYFASPADDVRCLEAWFEVLRPGGQLVVETMHRDRLAWSWTPDDEADDDAESGTTDWATGVRTTLVEIGGQTRQFEVRLYTATELIRVMQDVGFTQVEAYGGLDASPLDPSRRLVVRGVRPSR